jgi:hypothetical protein
MLYKRQDSLRIIMSKIFFKLVFIPLLCIMTISCNQQTSQNSKMTAIEVCEYANTTLNERSQYYYLNNGLTRVHLVYYALSARQITKKEQISSTYLRPNEWLIQVQITAIRENYLGSKWLTDMDKKLTILQYRFDEATATLEEIH